MKSLYSEAWFHPRTSATQLTPFGVPGVELRRRERIKLCQGGTSRYTLEHSHFSTNDQGTPVNHSSESNAPSLLELHTLPSMSPFPFRGAPAGTSEANWSFLKLTLRELSSRVPDTWQGSIWPVGGRHPTVFRMRLSLTLFDDSNSTYGSIGGPNSGKPIRKRDVKSAPNPLLTDLWFHLSILWSCNKQCFTLYCCLSGPTFSSLFPWSSNAMCCNSIMYTLSLEHQREGGMDESNGSLTLVVRTLTVPGNWSWNEQGDHWKSQEVPGRWQWQTQCSRGRQGISVARAQYTQESDSTYERALPMWGWVIWRAPILADFLPFSISSNPCRRRTKPRRRQTS